VRITVHQHRRPFWSNGACDDIGVLNCHRVHLDRVLGARSVTGPREFSLGATDLADIATCS
jgi:hypothetical protein